MREATYKVGDVKCIDDGRTRGIVIACEGRNLVSLIFDASILHKETDDLVRMLEKMKLSEVAVQNGYQGILGDYGRGHLQSPVTALPLLRQGPPR